ncbi:hypothetical protein ACP275_09G079700 [Erythranthe tilingii]
MTGKRVGVEVVVLATMMLLFSAQAIENNATPNGFFECYDDCLKHCHIFIKLICEGKCIYKCAKSIPPEASGAAPPLPFDHRIIGGGRD